MFSLQYVVRERDPAQRAELAFRWLGFNEYNIKKSIEELEMAWNNLVRMDYLRTVDHGDSRLGNLKKIQEMAEALALLLKDAKWA